MLSKAVVVRQRQTVSAAIVCSFCSRRMNRKRRHRHYRMAAASNRDRLHLTFPDKNIGAKRCVSLRPDALCCTFIPKEHEFFVSTETAGGRKRQGL